MSSLLYFNVSNDNNIKFQDDSNFIYDFLNCFCPDIQSRKDFIQYLLSFSSNKHEAISRQELLKLFIKEPSLFEKLLIDAKNLILVNNEFLESNKISKRGIDSDITSQSYSKLGELSRASLCLKKLLSILKHIRELILEVNCNNSFLNNLIKELNDIFNKNEYYDLLKILDYLESFRPEDNEFEVLINLNDSGKVSISNIICIDKGKTINRALPRNYDFTLLLKDSYENLFDIINSYIRAINFKFSYLYDELTFYKVSLRYYGYLNSKGINLTYPKFDNYTEIDNLRDFFLIATNSKVDNIVPNNFNLVDKNVVLITGDNGTGKTVFMRSIYFALLFGRAGLPIPAETATIELYNNIAIKFADNDTNISSSVGRFEKEVASISNIFYNIDDNSVVFFNEIFQSTSYSEAEYSLSNIVKSFSKRNVKCFLVTHLRELPSYFKIDEADNYLTSSDDSNRFKLFKNNIV